MIYQYNLSFCLNHAYFYSLYYNLALFYINAYPCGDEERIYIIAIPLKSEGVLRAEQKSEIG